METSGEPYEDSNSSWGSDSDEDARGSDDGERDDIGLSDMQYHDNGMSWQRLSVSLSLDGQTSARSRC
jgi:hypothetical protein